MLVGGGGATPSAGTGHPAALRQAPTCASSESMNTKPGSAPKTSSNFSDAGDSLDLVVDVSAEEGEVAMAESLEAGHTSRKTELGNPEILDAVWPPSGCLVVYCLAV